MNSDDHDSPSTAPSVASSATITSLGSLDMTASYTSSAATTEPSPAPSAKNWPDSRDGESGASSPHFQLVSPGDRRSTATGYRFYTTCTVSDDPLHKDQYGASSAPIYMSATFKGPPGAEFDYSRSGNPTRSELQHRLCRIQGCQYSFAVSSGMACLDVITRILKPGERIIAGDDLYGGTNRLLGFLASHGGVQADHVDTTDADKVEEILRIRAADAQRPLDDPLRTGPVKMVLLETPTNPLLKICDLERCAQAAKKWAPDALVVVDNTMMSPYLMRPLELGADVVYDSGTKYLSGHHDLMAGVIACDREDVSKHVAFTINSVGNALSPMDSWLLVRGIKTLAIRMDQQQKSAQLVAHYLHSLGFTVHYPGLPSHPSKAIHDRQAAGPGAVLSFETGDQALSERIVGAARLWGISVSFGCVNSLISMPCQMSHASIDPAVRAARRLPEDLIRLCVGIEDVRDLLEDLEFALLKAGAIRRKSPGSSHAYMSNAPADFPSFSEHERTQLHATPLPIADLIDGMDRAKIETRGGDPEQDARGKGGGGGAVVPAPAAPSSLLVSAPGKVILFGEHAVVHGVTAVAAAVDLRCFAHLTPTHDGTVRLSLPDLGVEHCWGKQELPWNAVSKREDGETGWNAQSQLDEALTKRISAVVGEVSNETERSHAGSIAFLYLYLSIVDRLGSGHKLVLRSAVPIGAGLGSSAALSTCMSAALLYTSGRLPTPDSAATISAQDATLLNGWSFLSEKIMHGNPSGVDNSVATFGGALAFTRAHAARNALQADEMRSLKGFSSVRFLLTNTGVGRDTKSLVAKVGQQLINEPARVESALQRIQGISDRASAVLGGVTGTPAAERNELLATLTELVQTNHEELVALGVSHPSLEAIRSTTEKYGLATKLTGAGGGGCAVTLLPDDLAPERLGHLVEELKSAGFECYETRVGGGGVGLIGAPSSSSSNAQERDVVVDGKAIDADTFGRADKKTLARWTEANGWAFV